MDWETGLIIVGTIATILTICWLSGKCSLSCFKTVDIGPLVMWFKMFSIIMWGTFTCLLFLHFFIGD